MWQDYLVRRCFLAVILQTWWWRKNYISMLMCSLVKLLRFPQEKFCFFAKLLHSPLCLFIKLCVPLKKLTFVRKISFLQKVDICSQNLYFHQISLFIHKSFAFLFTLDCKTLFAHIFLHNPLHSFAKRYVCVHLYVC